MQRVSHAQFLQGLLLGVVVSLLIGLLISLGRLTDISAVLDNRSLSFFANWVYTNLGMSLPIFALLLWLYSNAMGKLARELAVRAPIERIVQLDHLVDTWISLFFGVGVIWTAIGMRSALVFALGEPEVTLNLGAYAILERMVEGGILLALSTTIVGGIGGYLLRIIKTLVVDTELKQYYNQHAHAPGIEMQMTLNAIELHLRQLVRRTE